MNGLRYIRKQCNFSLSQLAERLETNNKCLGKWEKGNSRNEKEAIGRFFWY